MASVRNDKQKRNLLRSHHIVSLAGVFLLMFIVASTFIALVQYSKGTMAQTATSFGFTVAGDYDQTTSTTNNLQKIKQLYNANQISFHLGLGDFSYNTNLTAAQADAWSQYAKGNLPTNFPFEILAGRHDTAQMSTYKTDLPDHIGAISATCSACAYGQEYYFDYPVGAPLARFILISPNQTIPGYTYNYSKSGADYKWVSNTIDAARNAGIHWVIVGMHEYCFVIGTSSCSNQQLLDLLLNKHVDVILQAQKHNYQRSKQLALTPSSCTSQSHGIRNEISTSERRCRKWISVESRSFCVILREC